MSGSDMPGARSHRERPSITSGRICEFCGRPLPLGQGVSALVPDSAAIYTTTPELDGTRVAVACGSQHLDHLIARARDGWQDAQLWFARLCRTSSQPGLRGFSVTRLGERARLTDEELAAALAWNAEQPAALTALPGGQHLGPTPPGRSPGTGPATAADPGTAGC